MFARREEASPVGAARGVGADDTRVTGALVWDASVVLASYLSATLGPAARQRDGEPVVRLPAGAKCIELGCGLGLAGLAAAALGMDVTLTDRDEVLPLIAASVAANDVGRPVAVASLSWGDDDAAQALRPGSSSFDCVLMADVICAQRTIRDASLAIAHRAVVAKQLPARSFAWSRHAKLRALA